MDNITTNDIVLVLIIIGFSFGLFIVLRELFAWYIKTTEISTKMDRIISLLEQQNNSSQKNSGKMNRIISLLEQQNVSLQEHDDQDT